jgi:hypothetical protein
MVINMMITNIMIIVIFIVIYYIYYYYVSIKKSNKDICELINYKFNTGDIILFSYKSRLQLLNEKFTKRKYVHVGIIVDGDNKYIMHIVRGAISGIEKIDMNFWLNNDILEIGILPIKKPIDNTIMKNSYTKFLNLKYSNNKLIFLDSVNNIIPNIKYSGYNNDNTIICYEIVALILHDLGIIKNLKSKTYKYNTDSFINLPEYDKKNMKTFLIPSYNFNFGIIYLYNKILELIPIPKFIDYK